MKTCFKFSTLKEALFEFLGNRDGKLINEKQQCTFAENFVINKHCSNSKRKYISEINVTTDDTDIDDRNWEELKKNKKNTH